MFVKPEINLITIQHKSRVFTGKVKTSKNALLTPQKFFIDMTTELKEKLFSVVCPVDIRPCVCSLQDTDYCQTYLVCDVLYCSVEFVTTYIKVSSTSFVRKLIILLRHLLIRAVSVPARTDGWVLSGNN